MEQQEQQMDPWIKRVGGCVFYGFLLMLGSFLFLFGVIATYKGSNAYSEIFNKATAGGLVYIYFAVWGIIACLRKENEVEDREVSRLEWFAKHWKLVLGCVIFELFVFWSWHGLACYRGLCRAS